MRSAITLDDGGLLPGNTAVTPYPMAAEQNRLNIVVTQGAKQSVPDAPNGPALQDDGGLFPKFTDWIHASEGGEEGPLNQLGYSEGMQPRQQMKPPLTGRTLIPPSTAVYTYPGRSGPVGLDNQRGNLEAGVAQQNSDIWAQVDAVNQTFVTPQPTQQGLSW